MAKWLGGFSGGLDDHTPAAHIEAFKTWLWDKPLYRKLKGVTLHNAGAPNMTQTDHTPGGYDQRQRNLVHEYRDLDHWRGGPALNFYPDCTVRGGTPWGVYGVHSPSWNDTYIGVEMMADFRPGVDDDDAGRGLALKNFACECIAAILWHHRLPVNSETVKLHREDRATHHACPGSDIEKPDILARIQGYYAALSTPGEHPVTDLPVPVMIAVTEPRRMVVSIATLNLRDQGGMAGQVEKVLTRGQPVKVWSTSKNASTTWAHVTGFGPSETVPFDGYVALAYLTPWTADPVAAPAPVPQPVAIPTDKPHWAKQILMSKGLADFQAAGIIGNWQVESYPDLKPWVTGDYYLDGRRVPNNTPGSEPTAFGIAQARGARKSALDSFAGKRGTRWDDFETQVLFLHDELVNGGERVSGRLLLGAKNVLEATAAYTSAERPAGWHWPADRTNMAAVLAAAEKASHWDRRLAAAKALLAA